MFLIFSDCTTYMTMCRLNCNSYSQHCVHYGCFNTYTTCQPCTCLSAKAILANCKVSCADHLSCKTFEVYGAICDDDPQTYSCVYCKLKWGTFGVNWMNICPTGNDVVHTSRYYFIHFRLLVNIIHVVWYPASPTLSLESGTSVQ